MPIKLNAARRLLAAESPMRFDEPIKEGQFVEFNKPVNGKKYGKVKRVKGDDLDVLAADTKQMLRFGHGVQLTVSTKDCIRISIVDIKE